MINREKIPGAVEEFYQLLYNSQRDTNLDVNSEPNIVSSKKGIINQGLESLPDITLDEVELALRKTKNNTAPGNDNVVAGATKSPSLQIVH